MTAVDRILVTPRWGGGVESDWYPWLADVLGEPPVRRVPLPEADAPTIAGCRDAFAAALEGGDPATTLCVGHSVSVQGWLRVFQALDLQVAGLVAVAGWWSVDEPWETIRPWIDTGHDLDAIRARCPHIHVLLGTGDPFTSDQQRNAALWRERVGAQVRIVEDAAHFNDAEAPAVLETLRALS